MLEERKTETTSLIPKETPKQLPLAKIIAELVLSNLVMGNAVTTGINTYLGLTGLKVPQMAGNFLNGISGYLNGRFVPGTLGAWLLTPEMTRQQKMEMVAKVVGLVTAGITSGALLTEGEFVENPVLEGAIRATIGAVVASTTEMITSFAFRKLGFFKEPAPSLVPDIERGSHHNIQAYDEERKTPNH